jgi:hypothetical protein
MLTPEPFKTGTFGAGLRVRTDILFLIPGLGTVFWVDALLLLALNLGSVVCNFSSLCRSKH